MDGIDMVMKRIPAMLGIDPAEVQAFKDSIPAFANGINEKVSSLESSMKGIGTLIADQTAAIGEVRIIVTQLLTMATNPPSKVTGTIIDANPVPELEPLTDDTVRGSKLKK